MGRITATVISLMCFINFVLAQEGNLIIQGVSPNLYVVHKTAAKENYYSVGRMYNVTPKGIAAYNKLEFEKGLNLGQSIKIPLTKNNFTQTNAALNKTRVPVYHVVTAKEGLYRVSVNYNKVPLQQLKKWNNLSSDAVTNGTKLIVGYLNTEDQGSLAKNATYKNEIAVTVTDDKNTANKNAAVSKEIPPEVTNSSTVKVADDKNNVAAEKKPIQEKNSGVIHTVNFSGGAFKKLYDEQLTLKAPVTESGLSGVFKSTSGWRDGKYYCFHNSAPPGTILRITNSLNGKNVYAKVLDIIPDISQNAGLILHVSNAAAEELGVSAARFDCSINYAK